jgi:RNA polymerase sigma-70 factor (ECF subfamily)
MSNSNFASTNWSLVQRAGQKGGKDSSAALADLCERYWYPLYAFLRRKGLSQDRAEDLTQGFFTQLIDKQVIGQAEPLRGRFRSFLLTSMENFLVNDLDRANALKRGGGRPILSLDLEGCESKLASASGHAHELTPEKVFDRAWAIELLEIVMGRLASESAAKGKAEQFEVLRSFLSGDSDTSYEQAAATLGISQPAARQAVHRLRSRFGELLRQEVTDTVADENEVEDEIRGLFSALGD